MKICIVCARLSYGGAERVAVTWANGFSQKGHRVMVVSNLYDSITYKLDEGIEVKNLVTNEQNRLKKWISSFYNVRKLLKDFCPDVIIGVMEICSMVAKISSLGMKIPVVMTEHWSFERPNNIGMPLVYRFSKFYVNRIYDLVTILTEADRKVIGNRLKNVYVLPNPLAIEPVQIIPPKENVILAVGRLDGWHVKGFDLLIRAWAQVVTGSKFQSLPPNPSPKVDGNNGWKLQIAGAGSEDSLNYLRQLCKENLVADNVEFLGFVSDMKSLYKKSSVFVLSSRYEGFGLVLIEAMSQGCACVACDFKGRQREIIEDDTQGLCCEPENVEELAAAINRMITDSEYRESVREQAIKRSKYYSVDNTIGRWEQLLSKIVKN